MKKFLLIGAFAFMAHGLVVAAHRDCFRPYPVSLANMSGGVAEVKKSKGIRGVSRKSEISPNSSVRILIQKRGAEIEVSAGPEGNKSNREIKFYSKDHKSLRQMATLHPKGFTAEGFSTKPVTFSVKIDNQSDGIARIINSCDTSGKGTTIGAGKSANITVRPSSSIIVEAGPEKHKMLYNIIFADQRGDNPTVILSKRGFLNSGVTTKNVDIQLKRATAIRPKHPEMTPIVMKKEMKDQSGKMDRKMKKVSRSQKSYRRKKY